MSNDLKLNEVIKKRYWIFLKGVLFTNTKWVNEECRMLKEYFHRINNGNSRMTSNNQLISNQFQFHSSGMVSGYNSNFNENH